LNDLIANDHPLLDLRPEAINDWAHWKSMWDELSFKSFEQRLGLLHVGFDVPAISGGSFASPEKRTNAEVERLCFYLRLADGHYRGNFVFMTASEAEHCHRQHGDMPSPTQVVARLRAEISRKAFIVVVDKFFRNTRRPSGTPSWFPLAVENRVFEMLLWFFRLDRYGHISNLTSHSSGQIAPVHYQRTREFVTELIRLGWGMGDSFDDLSVEAKLRLTVIRPRLIELMDGLGDLDSLLGRFRHLLDEECWSTLEALALRPRQIRIAPKGYENYETRKPTTLQEAFANGSEAARVLILLKTLRDEDERFEQLKKAARQLQRLIV
jgi:hypothetical protein